MLEHLALWIERFNRQSLFIDSRGSSLECCIFPFSLIHRRKLLSRIAELEEFVEQGRNRAAKLEKEKNKMQIEIRDVTIECDKVWFLNNPGCDNRIVTRLGFYIIRDMTTDCEKVKFLSNSGCGNQM